jgi:heavy metal sensor kinase
MFNSVRVRLTLWYVLVFGGLLVGFSIFLYISLARQAYARLDHSLANAAETAVAAFNTEMDENGGDASAGAVEALHELRLPDLYVAVFNGNRPLGSNLPGSERVVLSDELLSQASIGATPVFAGIDGFGEEGARLAVAAAPRAGGDYYIAVVAPLHEMIEQLESLRQTFYLGLPAALLIAGAGGLLLARKSLAPVTVMSNQAAHISARNLHERLRVINATDELGHLALVFNDLLSRLDQSFESMRRFMADASHELRTPLAIIRGEADVALSQERDAAEYREALAIVQDEARRLSRIVDDMLALARADAGQRPLKIEEFYLNDLLEECSKAAGILALRKPVSLTTAPSPDVAFRGDEDMLRRMVLNLLDNAIKYTPAGGAVSVKLVREAATVKIVVSDNGVGIPAEAAGRIFERFYRVDQSRSRAEGGSGLGLSIARWVAEAHNGKIELVSEPGRGSTFIITLPI